MATKNRNENYFWEGKSLLMDTVVHRKRFHLDARNRRHFFSFDIRRWVTPPEDEIAGRTWEKISRKHRREFNGIDRRQLLDTKAKAVWHFVVERIRYRRDSSKHDFWQFPSETLAFGHGDCEDKAFLCASLLLAAGIPKHRVRVVLGGLSKRISRERRIRYEGHSWPMFRNRHGVWCILEPNLPHLPMRIKPGAEAEVVLPKQSLGIRRSVFLSADRLSADNRRQQYVPLVCFHHESVWTVEQTVSGFIENAKGLEPKWQQNPTFHEILRAGRTQDL